MTCTLLGGVPTMYHTSCCSHLCCVLLCIEMRSRSVTGVITVFSLFFVVVSFLVLFWFLRYDVPLLVWLIYFVVFWCCLCLSLTRGGCVHLGARNAFRVNLFNNYTFFVYNLHCVCYFVFVYAVSIALMTSSSPHFMAFIRALTYWPLLSCFSLFTHWLMLRW